MKRIWRGLLLIGEIIGIAFPVPAQPRMDTANMTSLPMMQLKVTTGKTTTLVFPGEIKSVDRGSRDLLVQTIPGMSSMLQLKAARKDFPETNLTVVTAEGKLYAFLIGYAEDPGAYAITVKTQPYEDILPPSGEAAIRENAMAVAGKDRTVFGIKQRRFGMKLVLQGLYLDGVYGYFLVGIRNGTNIPYDIDFLRCELKDRQQPRRTAAQSLQLAPVYTTATTPPAIAPWGEKRIVLVLPRFTIPDKKKLLLRINEHNGGRHLQIAVSNRVLMQVQPLNNHDK